MMNNLEYKKYHESFMQDNHGTTAFHTFCCIFLTVQCAIFITIRRKYHPPVFQIIYEYFVLVLPLTIAHTILADYIYVLNCIMLAILLNELFTPKVVIPNIRQAFAKNNFFKNDRIPFVTTLRGLTYIITAFAILAVDFQVFPRYLAKTERYGYSFMDTGVGLFVLVSGLVHKELHRGTYMNILKGHLKPFSVFVILGTGRYLTIRHFDYHTHVTEYGVHWNFFFTIAICKVVSTVLLCFSKRAVILSAITLMIHEYILYDSLQDWVFGGGPRDTLISANREGISSCLGYVSIYLFAVHIKQLLVTKNVSRYEILKRLVSETVLLWIFTYFFNVFRPASRALANAAYIVYLDTLLITVTSVMFFFTVMYEDRLNKQSYILDHINNNGLIYFLLSNLFTGGVNLYIRTLMMPTALSLIILNVYMITTIMILLKVNRIV